MNDVEETSKVINEQNYYAFSKHWWLGYLVGSIILIVCIKYDLAPFAIVVSIFASMFGFKVLSVLQNIYFRQGQSLIELSILNRKADENYYRLNSRLDSLQLRLDKMTPTPHQFKNYDGA